MWVYWQEKSIPSGCCEDDDYDGDDTKTILLWSIFFFSSLYTYKMDYQGVCCILTVVLVAFPFCSEKNKGFYPRVKQTFQMLLWLFWCTLSEVGLFWLCCVMIKVLVDCPFEILKFWLEMFLFYRFTFTIIFRFIPLNDMLVWCSTCVCEYFINSTVHERVVDITVGLFVCLFVFLKCMNILPITEKKTK